MAHRLRRDAEGLKEGGIEVHLRDRRAQRAAGLDAGAFDEAGDMRASGIDTGFAAIGMPWSPVKTTMVLVCLAAGFELLHHLTDEGIHAQNAGIILREVDTGRWCVRQPRQHSECGRVHIGRCGVAVLGIAQLVLHMLPPGRVGIARIAPKEPGFVSSGFDDGVEIVRLHKGVVREVSRGLLMQFARESAIHATGLEHLNEVRDVLCHAARREEGGIIRLRDRVRQRNPLLRSTELRVSVVAVAPDAVRVRQQPAVDRRLARRAHALSAEGAGEVHALSRKLVEIRRLQAVMPAFGSRAARSLV